jgi:diadenosine tetraphosphate (Ap4A) HIT family hydrolase
MALAAADTDFLLDLIQTVQSLVKELNLEASGYRLIANGGAYQDVPHLHFHLISEAKSKRQAAKPGGS